MEMQDLQVSDVWTLDSFRGRGIATEALKRIIFLKKKTGRRFWYLTRKANFASIRVAEKSGLIRAGRGCRRKRCGLRVLGYFEMTTEESSPGT